MGLNNTESQSTPQNITFFNDKKIKKIYSGSNHNMIITGIKYIIINN